MYSIFPAMYPGAITRGESEKINLNFGDGNLSQQLCGAFFFCISHQAKRGGCLWKYSQPIERTEFYSNCWCFKVHSWRWLKSNWFLLCNFLLCWCFFFLARPATLELKNWHANELIYLLSDSGRNSSVPLFLWHDSGKWEGDSKQTETGDEMEVEFAIWNMKKSHF